MKVGALILGATVGLGLGGCDEVEQAPESENGFRTEGLQSPFEGVAVPVPTESVCSIKVKNHGTKDMETNYLPNVLACEAPGSAGLEMLKAQAIAARSYAYYHAIESGEICNGQGCQVFSCGRTPTDLHRKAVEDTSGVVMRYNENLTIGFYVAGDSSPDANCKGNSSGVGNTERYVTYNEGVLGSDITQSRIAWRHNPSDRDWGQNRGALSQWGAHCLANDFDYETSDILRYYYGEDIELQQTTGTCVDESGVDIDVDGEGGGSSDSCGEVSPDGETIIDNDDDCFKLSGPQQYWRTENAGHGGTLRWTKSTRVTESNVATWNLNFSESGLFRIEAHIDTEYTSGTDAVYEVVDGGQSRELTVDQTIGDWVNLGVYRFEAGAAGQQVRMSDAIGIADQQLQADALRLTPVEDEACEGIECRADDASPEAGAGARGDEDEGGGCAVGGGRNPPTGAAALLLLGLFGRRRRN